MPQNDIIFSFDDDDYLGIDLEVIEEEQILGTLCLGQPPTWPKGKEGMVGLFKKRKNVTCIHDSPAR